MAEAITTASRARVRQMLEQFGREDQQQRDGGRANDPRQLGLGGLFEVSDFPSGAIRKPRNRQRYRAYNSESSFRSGTSSHREISTSHLQAGRAISGPH